MSDSFPDEGVVIDRWLERAEGDPSPQDRPLIIVSVAVSLDGCLAARYGERTTISGEEAMLYTHYMRSKCRAILIGINTLLADDPLLTVRRCPGEDPVPIVIDTSLRTPTGCRLLTESRNPLIYYNSQNLSSSPPMKSRDKILTDAGATCIQVPAASSGNGVDLHAVLRSLRDRGFRRVMVEGGAKILHSLLAARLWDRLACTVAPVILGGYPLMREDGSFAAVRPEPIRWISCGRDRICLGWRKGP